MSAQRQVLLACLPGLAALLWQFGWGTPLQLLVTLPCALLCAQAERRLLARPAPDAGNALVSGALLGLSLPAGAPFWVGASACVFGLLAGRTLFGGSGRNPLNPAMLGYLFALLAFPAAMSQWPLPGQPLELSQAFSALIGQPPTDAFSGATLLDNLRHERALTIDERFASLPAFGHVAAAGSEWVNLGFLLGGLWLLQRRVIDWRVPAGMLGALALLALLSWHGNGSDSYGSPLLQLFSGASMLGAFFIASEPVSGARSPRGRLYFGLGVGALVYLLRVYGGYADGVAIAVLAMNLCVPSLERLARRERRR